MTSRTGHASPTTEDEAGRRQHALLTTAGEEVVRSRFQDSAASADNDAATGNNNEAEQQQHSLSSDSTHHLKAAEVVGPPSRPPAARPIQLWHRRQEDGGDGVGDRDLDRAACPRRSAQVRGEASSTTTNANRVRRQVVLAARGIRQSICYCASTACAPAPRSSGGAAPALSEETSAERRSVEKDVAHRGDDETGSLGGGASSAASASSCSRSCYSGSSGRHRRAALGRPERTQTPRRTGTAARGPTTNRRSDRKLAWRRQ